MPETPTQTDDKKAEETTTEAAKHDGLEDIVWTNLDDAHKKVWKDFEEAKKQRSFVFHLDLSYQQMKVIPKEIGCLNKVISCSFSGNDLKDDSFPEEFFEMSFLQELDLSHNHLQHLPPCLCMFIDLKKLNLSGNEFEDPSYQASLVKKLFPECEVIW